MLRISIIDSAPDSATLRLEGHLVGAWIGALRDTCEQMLHTGRSVTLDLGEVSLIERPGFDLLASLSRRTVFLVGCSPFQLEQLRQAATMTQDNTTQP